MSPSPSPLDGLIPIVTNEANISAAKIAGIALVLVFVVFALAGRGR